MIAAVSDKDTKDSYDTMLARRNKTLKIRDELYGAASDVGKRMLDKAMGPIKQMNELEDQAGKFALLTQTTRRPNSGKIRDNRR